ncbi:MAG: hypothetical protein E7467_03290 [Ruminococcaceae bacterium]|nr:hypothetical protein [Oscillospiraceae bacterium]
MKELIGRLIDRYGSTMQVTSGKTTKQIKAFLQLVTSKSWQNMERMIPTVGEIPRGQFLYLGPPEVLLSGYDTLLFDGRQFIIRRADAIVYRNERIFVWGLCVEGGLSL